MLPSIAHALRRRAVALGQWLWLGGLVGGACGVLSAVFLTLLERATEARQSHPALVFALPAAGLAIGFVYARWGTSIRDGNSLVIDTVHEERRQLPLRMAPMVLVGTVLTHLFGGSAGREGTAVQMGASVADAIAHRLKVVAGTRRALLAAGMAGGFGSVFGTPLAGAVFGLEVLTVGRLDYAALAPALVAAVVGDVVTRGLGITHTAYPVVAGVDLSLRVAAAWLACGVAMAMAAVAFIELTHGAKRLLTRAFPWLGLRMMMGGAAVVVLWQLVGTDAYLGLGVPGIVAAFRAPGVPDTAFAWKLAFTVVTLGAGFLGGEVTPLFFVGATLGSTLAKLFGLPLAWGAAMGLGAVFGAAANTPMALTIMTVELCGSGVLPHVAVVTVLAYLLSGHRSIYPAQRLVRSKRTGETLPEPIALRDLGRRSPSTPRERSSEAAERSDAPEPPA